MNERLKFVKNSLGVPYAISGSMAMRLYGKKYNVKTREPGNVNVVVNRKHLNNAYSTLFNSKSRNVPRNTSSKKQKNHYNLHPFDLLKAGTELAPSINTYVELNGIPVVSLENLLKHKRISLRNAPGVKESIMKSNINTLEELIKRSNRSPLKIKRRVNNRTPHTVTRNHNNNFSTPPRTTRKALFGNNTTPPRGKKLMF
jgi:hypothetical protein